MLMKILTSAAKMRTPEITATTIPATTPASRPLLEIPVPGFGVSVTPVKDSVILKTRIEFCGFCKFLAFSKFLTSGKLLWTMFETT